MFGTNARNEPGVGASTTVRLSAGAAEIDTVIGTLLIVPGYMSAGTPDTALAKNPAVRTPATLQSAIAGAAARWAEVVDKPEATFSAGFGRGLAYYDGFVFELEAPTLGPRASLGGGGRYDGLLHRVAASEAHALKDTASWGAIGFALRPARMDEAAP